MAVRDITIPQMVISSVKSYLGDERIRLTLARSSRYSGVESICNRITLCAIGSIIRAVFGNAIRHVAVTNEFLITL